MPSAADIAVAVPFTDVQLAILREKCPGIGDATLRRNADTLLQAFRTRKGETVYVRTFAPMAARPARAEPESTAQNAPHEPSRPQAAYSGRVALTITSYRCGQLCDPDNLAAKYIVDGLRYASILRDDSPDEIEYTIRQKRVPTKKEEGTLIEITPLP